jgi:hypothetical protein
MTDPVREAAERIVGTRPLYPVFTDDAVLVARAYLAIPPAQPGAKEELARIIHEMPRDRTQPFSVFAQQCADAILAAGFRRDGVREAGNQ